jgi:hypothetical protein
MHHPTAYASAYASAYGSAYGSAYASSAYASSAYASSAYASSAYSSAYASAYSSAGGPHRGTAAAGSLQLRGRCSRDVGSGEERVVLHQSSHWVPNACAHGATDDLVPLRLQRGLQQLVGRMVCRQEGILLQDR